MDLQIEVHAGRFEDDDEKRADDSTPYYSNPAVVGIKKGEEVVLTIKDGIVYPTIDGKAQMLMSIGPWDYTAVAITFKREN